VRYGTSGEQHYALLQNEANSRVRRADGRRPALDASCELDESGGLGEWTSEEA